MEKGLAYIVETFYDHYCVRCSDNKILFGSNGELYDQLNWIKKLWII